MKRLLFFILFFIAFNLAGFSQNSSLTFQVTWKGEEIILGNKYYSTHINDSIQFDRMRFYVSNLAFENEEDTSYFSQQFILIDLEKPTSFSLDSIQNFKNIYFNLGIDSITNVSGAFGGDLDPTLGMYWSWQSGYINFKLEGKSDVITSKNKAFQFHLGGYSFPNKTVTQVSLKAEKKAQTIIELPIDELIKKFNLVKLNTIMSPSKEAVKLNELIGQTFIIK